jgi:hypothetical protein
MTESAEQYLQRAIATLSQSDPLVKLLQQVRLGRMKATDPGLRAVTESWLSTYQKILEQAMSLDEGRVRRLDPSPRLDVLIEAGVLADGHPSVVSVRTAFQQALAGAQARAGT